MSAPILAEIDPAGITTVRFANGAGKGLFCRGYSDKVYMVWHKAPRPDFHPTFSAPFGHEREVFQIIVVTEEGLLAAIAALGDVVRDAGCNNSRHSCHAQIVAERVVMSIEYTVPGIPRC